MIKLFSSGLGEITSASTQQSSLGLSPSQLVRLVQSQQSLPIEGGTLKNTIQVSSTSIKKNTNPVDLPRVVIDTGIVPKVFSKDSGPASFETLFHDFDLIAFPVFNFWTPDETTNDKDELGDRKLEDVPRYVRLSWKIAPELHSPGEKVKPKDVSVRSNQPVFFGHSQKPEINAAGGVTFSLPHLKPDDFSLVKTFLSNGFVSPGALETIVEIPSIDPIASSGNRIDEDTFLTDPRFAGMSLPEINSQLDRLKDGISPSLSPVQSDFSPSIEQQKTDIFDGKFSFSQGFSSEISLKGVHASSPALGIDSLSAESIRPSFSDPLKDISDGAVVPPTNKSSFSKVKFFDTSIGGLVDQQRINLMSAPEHVEVLAALAPSLGNLETFSRTGIFDINQQKEFPSLPSPNVNPLEYIGYVIEKYKRSTTGAFLKVEEIDITSREINSYVDTKVLYGETYRYRIRALLRWTRPSNLGIFGIDGSTQPTFSSPTGPTAPFKSSYFSSEWNQKWAYGTCVDTQPPPPPDEITVRPESSRKRIVVTMKFPDDSQKDILKMRLLRKFKDENGKDISNWEYISQGGVVRDFPPRNSIYFDENVDFFQNSKVKVVYAAQTISRHGEISCLSEQIAARLNAKFKTHGEYPNEFISCAGVRIEYYGSFSTNPRTISYAEMVIDVGADNSRDLVISGRDSFGNIALDSGKYVLRAQSLETGEVVDVPFSASFSLVQDRIIVQTTDAVLPSIPRNSPDSLREGFLASQRNMKKFDTSSKPVSSQPPVSPLFRPGRGSR